VPDWELVTGTPGSVFTTMRHTTDIPTPGGFDTAIDWLYRDEANPSESQCWGDAHHTGVHGSWVVEAIPNTDPESPPFNNLEVERTVRFAPPGLTVDEAAAWSDQIDNPLVVGVTPYELP
jgi:hypothetical protein